MLNSYMNYLLLIPTMTTAWEVWAAVYLVLQMGRADSGVKNLRISTVKETFLG